MVGQLIAQTNYRGRWVLTPDFKLREDFYVVCVDGQVQAVTNNRPDGAIVEHDGLILPGLINAHTHLEFSDLVQPLGESGMDFVSWVGQVIQYRNSREDSQAQNAILKGLSECANEGTVAIGEISTFDWHGESEPGLDLVDFRELIGFRESQFDSLMQVADLHVVAGKSQLGSAPVVHQPWHAGLSPHAPYSVNHKTIDFAIEQSAQNGIPLAMHLAETKEELELLRDHRGPFFDLLNRMDLWTETNFSRGTTPSYFLKRLAFAHRALVVHGNYLTAEELKFIAEHQDVLKLVYCPRTHEYFRHEPYPLNLIDELGIKFALGTDSRASNPDLSIWNEMEFLYQLGKVSASTVLKAGTINGAQALGMENKFGQIGPGKSGKLFFAPPPEQSEFSHALVFEP